MSPALASLGEDLLAAESLARALPALFAATKKPVVVVVDGAASTIPWCAPSRLVSA